MPGQALKRPVQHASISFHGTSATLVAAVSGKQIVPIDIMVVAAEAVELYLKSSGGTTHVGDATDGINLAATSGWRACNDDHGLFACVKGEALQVVTSAAVSCGGFISYVTLE